MSKSCPICLGLYERIDLSENVCDFHEKYFVIVCECGRTVFSDNTSLCIRCSNKKSNPRGFCGYNKDHRFYLQMIGQEGKPTRGL